MAERLIPGGSFVIETGSAQRQIPGGPFVNETLAAGGTNNLTVGSDAQAASSSTGVVSQVHILLGVGATSSASSGTGSVTQVHVLLGAAVSQNSTSGTGAITVSSGYSPTGDVSTTGWVATPSGALYACIDESTSADDVDYITSPNITGTASPAKFNIGPISAGSYQLNIRAKSSDGGASVLRVKFYDSGNTLLTTAGPLTLTSTFQTFTPSFSISDTAVYVTIEATTT